MRKITFRGISQCDGSMVYGDLTTIYFLDDANQTQEAKFIRSVDSDGVTQGGLVRVHNNTVGQFTGFCDKTGNEIYEGDIVKGAPKYLGEVAWSAGYGRFEIGFKNGKILDFSFNTSEKLKVVGNVHQTPELLGE